MWLSPAHPGSWGPGNWGAADLPLLAGPLPAHLAILPWLQSLCTAQSPWRGFPFSTNCNNCPFFFGQENLEEGDRERAEVSDGPASVRWVHTALNTHSISAPRHTAGQGSSLRKLSIKKSASLQCQLTSFSLSHHSQLPSPHSQGMMQFSSRIQLAQPSPDSCSVQAPPHHSLLPKASPGSSE